MNSIMQSIKPKYCELIAAGRKTYEVRKTKPNIPTPFKAYIYETKDKKYMNLAICVPDKNINFIHAPGKVIAEYICDEIIEWTEDMKPPVPLSKLCLTYSQIRHYGGDKPLYLWHITNLKIYDEPKELSAFKGHKRMWYGSIYLPLTRPPQSWLYCEEVAL